MMREIKSNQRKVRVLHFIANAAGTALTGPDAKQVTLGDTATGIKTITLNRAFGSASQYVVQVTNATAATISQVSITSSSVFIINSFAVDGTTATDAITHVTVIGTDITDQF